MSRTLSNPYSGVTWATDIQCKTNLHTHTICSDAKQYDPLQTPVNLVNKYADYGYDALSITDHDTVDSGHGNELVHPDWTHKPYATYPLSDFPNNGEDALVPIASHPKYEIYTGLGTTADKTMLVIKGIEITPFTYNALQELETGVSIYRHHIVCLFADFWTAADVAAGYVALGNNEPANRANIDINASPWHYKVCAGTKVNDMEWLMEQIATRAISAIIAHPGYHNEKYPAEGDDDYDANNYAWYLQQYKNCSTILGQEVFTWVFTGSGYTHNDSRNHWDAVLTQLMPTRKVWGFASTDDHTCATICGIEMTMVLMPSLTGANFETALQNGAFYFIADPEGNTVGRHTASPPTFPTISNIVVDTDSKTITITANNATAYRWVFDGKNIARGNVLNYANKDVSYVRCEIDGADGSMALTQPFALMP